MAIGLPGTAAGMGRPGRTCCVVSAVEAAGALDACRVEFSDTNVAHPSTSAIAAPAARPRLSRRERCRATTGNAFWLARTSAFSLSSSRGSVCGTAGSDAAAGFCQGPRTVLPVASMVTRLVVMIGIRQLVAIEGGAVAEFHRRGCGRIGPRLHRLRLSRRHLRDRLHRNLLRLHHRCGGHLSGHGGRRRRLHWHDAPGGPQDRVPASIAEDEVRRDWADDDIFAAHAVIDRTFLAVLRYGQDRRERSLLAPGEVERRAIVKDAR